MVNWKAAVPASFILLAATLCPPVAAQESDLPGFRTPSDNIHCLIESWTADNGQPKSQLRCDVMQITAAIPPKPRDCEFDWGQVFAIMDDGTAGKRLCYSDSAMNPGYRVLGYGAVWQRGRYTCTSERTGLTCRNALGHGFTLSKGAQRLF